MTPPYVLYIEDSKTPSIYEIKYEKHDLMACKNSVIRKTPEEWFYDKDWTAAMEVKLVNELLHLKEMSLWVNNSPNEDAASIVRDTFNEAFGTTRDAVFLTGKIAFLKERYNIFVDIIDRNCVKWDSKNNYVEPCGCIWESIDQVITIIHCFFYSTDAYKI